jgi:hypothetical protein
MYHVLVSHHNRVNYIQTDRPTRDDIHEAVFVARDAGPNLEVLKDRRGVVPRTITRREFVAVCEQYK